MTTMALSSSFMGLFPCAPTSVQSDAGVASERMLCGTFTEIYGALSLGRLHRAICEGVERVRAECSTPGWDGYGADPVQRAVCSLAETIGLQLPSWLSAPEVGADTDGDLSLDWYSGSDAFSLSISAEGKLHYACRMGQVRTHGSEMYYGAIPDAVLEALLRFHRRATRT